MGHNYYIKEDERVGLEYSFRALEDDIAEKLKLLVEMEERAFLEYTEGIDNISD